MLKRYVSLWFRHLLTDRLTIREPALMGKAFVLAEAQRGRKVVTAATAEAERFGILPGMTISDAKVITPDLQVFDGVAGRNEKLLKGLAEWCLRYTPQVAIDLPDGLLLDVTGCTHLKGGERAFLKDLTERLAAIGYDVRPGMADTIGCAWGVARCAKKGLIVSPGKQRDALIALPPSALRLPTDLLIKLHHLGLSTIGSFIHMPKSVIRRRFSKDMVLRLHQALGQEEEFLVPIQEPVPYSERLACLEPVRTRPAIEAALGMLLQAMCKRLYGEGKGLRTAVLTYFRIDGKNGVIEIGTNQATHRSEHLFKLFHLKLDGVAPGLGIELFVLDALKTEPVDAQQTDLWAGKPGSDSEQVAELLDRVAGRTGSDHVRRYLPVERFWPERSALVAGDLGQKPQTFWRTDKPRPFQLIDPPEVVEAMALTPDYPPKLFIYNGKKHTIVNADGPERIEREWWQDQGEHRDYYVVEDEDGGRYWLFRSGFYDPDQPQHWYIHGFFA